MSYPYFSATLPRAIAANGSIAAGAAQLGLLELQAGPNGALILGVGQETAGAGGCFGLLSFETVITGGSAAAVVSAIDTEAVAATATLGRSNSLSLAGNGGYNFTAAAGLLWLPEAAVIHVPGGFFFALVAKIANQTATPSITWAELG
jgi:hypothetical protein